MCGKGSATTTQTTAPNPMAMGAYQNVLNRAQQAARAPFVPYTGEFTAPINQQQQLGVGNINANAGFASPYISQAGQFATQAAQPITGAQIGQYMSPYTQAVVNATQAQFNNANQMQQQNLRGNAIAQGALGGDREKIAEAVLGGQQQLAQAPVIAGLYNQGYGQAVNTALAEQQAMAQGAYSLGNLGIGGQQAALAGAGAQFGAGTAEQQTQQAQDTALYNQFLAQQAYPFQTAQYLAGITGAMAPGYGSTTTTQGPPPSSGAQMAGLGIAGFGALGQAGYLPSASTLAGFLPFSDRRVKNSVHKIGETKDGQPIYRFRYNGSPQWHIGLMAQEVERDHPEAVHSIAGIKAVDYKTATDDAARWHGGAVRGYDIGGQVSGFGAMPYAGGRSYVPEMQLQPVQLAHPQFPQQQQQPGVDLYRLIDQSFKKPSSGNAITVNPDFISPTGNSISGAIESRYGGGVRGYDDGGPVQAGFGTGSLVDDFDQRYDAAFPKPVSDGPVGGMFGGMGYEPTGWSSGTYDTPLSDQPLQPTPQAGVDMLNAAFHGQGPASSPADEVQEPGLVGTPPVRNREPQTLPEYDPYTQRQYAGLGLEAGEKPKEKGGVSPEFWQSVMAAGLGMMASRSPYFGTAVCEGGLKGIEAYHAAVSQKQKQQAIDEGVKRLDAQLARQRVLEQQGATRLGIAQQQANTMEEYRRRPYKIGNDPQTGADIFVDPTTGKRVDLTGGEVPAQNTQPSPAAPKKEWVQEAADKGILNAHAELLNSGPYNYSQDGPYIEKGMDVPEPQTTGGKSVDSLKLDAENYIQTGKLPRIPMGKSPVAIQQRNYVNAVQNYASALLASRGLTPQQAVDMWRSAPGMLRFILGADGRSTVSLGTAVRHIDTIRQLADLWNSGNWNSQTANRLKAAVAREFGNEAVTNLETAARIVGPEIVKAIGVAGAGTEAERLIGQIAFSPKLPASQIIGNANTLQTLLGGQLEGRKRQAAAAGVSEEKFRGLIGDRPYELLTHAGVSPTSGVSGQAPTIGSKDEYDKLPSGTVFTGADGKKYKKP